MLYITGMKNKKRYIAVKQVQKFIAKQPDMCQVEYLAIVEQLEMDGFLVEPYAKKIDKDLFEIRIRRGRQVRVLYYYNIDDLIIGVHAFVKKTRTTPIREIKQAHKVISKILRGEYNE